MGLTQTKRLLFFTKHSITTWTKNMTNADTSMWCWIEVQCFLIACFSVLSLSTHAASLKIELVTYSKFTLFSSYILLLKVSHCVKHQQVLNLNNLFNGTFRKCHNFFMFCIRCKVCRERIFA